MDTYFYCGWLWTRVNPLLVGFLEYVIWWGGVGVGAIRPPPQISRTNRPISIKRHSIPIIVNFQNHYKKSKKSKIGDSGSKNFRKFRDVHPITKIAITSLFLVRCWWNFGWSFLMNRAFTYILVFLNIRKIIGGGRLLILGCIFIILSDNDKNKSACRWL